MEDHNRTDFIYQPKSSGRGTGSAAVGSIGVFIGLVVLGLMALDHAAYGALQWWRELFAF